MIVSIDRSKFVNFLTLLIIIEWNLKMKMVSVIIPVYNAESTLKRCIDSVLMQCYENVEVIAVDDGSTDKSLLILEEIIANNKNVRVYKQINSGACVARNKGLELSLGEYIKFLDSDDFLERGALSAQIKAVKSLATKVIPYGYRNILCDGELKKSKNILNSSEQACELINNNIITTLPLHQRDALIEIGLFDENLKFRQEWDLHLRLVNSGFTFQYHDDCIYTQCIHDSIDRISSRKFIAKKELDNLNSIRSKFNFLKDSKISAAWSCKYWTVGRQFLKAHEHTSAKLFFDISKEISPKCFLMFQPLIYKISYYVFGVSLTEKFLFMFKKIKSLILSMG